MRTYLAGFRVVSGELPLSAVLLQNVRNGERLLGSGCVLDRNRIFARRQSGDDERRMLCRVERPAKELSAVVGLRARSVQLPFVADVSLPTSELIFVGLDCVGDSLETVRDCGDGTLLHSGGVPALGVGKELLRRG